MKTTAIFTISFLLFIGSVAAQSVTINPAALDLPRVTSLPSCSASTKGRMVYNTTDNRMYYCNGSAWINTEVAGPQNAPAFGVANIGGLNIETSGTTIVPFTTESYDIGNNFNLAASGVDPNTFIAPFDGIYHFDAYVSLNISGATIISSNFANIQLLVNNAVATQASYIPVANSNFILQISRDLKLVAGDKVKVAVFEDVAGTQYLKMGALMCTFSGHLVTKY